MHERTRFDTLLALVERLVEENERRPILVEGQRDVQALRALGCEGEVLPLKGAAGLADVAHALALRDGRDVILLPDWDRAGLALCDAALAHLAAHGLRCDLHFHQRLVDDTDLTMKDVETLAAIVARGLRRYHFRSLEEHVRSRRGDPLGVDGLRDEFAHVPAAPPRSSRERRPSPKRRARPRE